MGFFCVPIFVLHVGSNLRLLQWISRKKNRKDITRTTHEREDMQRYTMTACHLSLEAYVGLNKY